MRSLKQMVRQTRVRVRKKFQRLRVGYQMVRLRMVNEYRRADLFRAQGAQIGNGCRFLIHYLTSEPYLITVGDETLVTGR